MEEIITAAGGLIATVISWFLAKRKYTTEVDHSYLTNLEKALETYNKIVDRNKSEITFLMEENSELRKELSDLRKQVLDLSLNICMHLKCPKRVREYQVVEVDNKEKIKAKLDSIEKIK